MYFFVYSAHFIHTIPKNIAHLMLCWFCRCFLHKVSHFAVHKIACLLATNQQPHCYKFNLIFARKGFRKQHYFFVLMLTTILQQQREQQHNKWIKHVELFIRTQTNNISKLSCYLYIVCSLYSSTLRTAKKCFASRCSPLGFR